ncbi:flagellar protein FlaG [Duganella aceris]|uniref:Flagellar protein FlaG n=1 Tax=Duganella aceris TaxID=2703883 RepID=A0ABX0FL31_9BURK|nr:flagellar protein FlaG [Duganella aceris]NGZ85235.1 flagellar protein FlaG [Duganella aceris]
MNIQPTAAPAPLPGSAEPKALTRPAATGVKTTSVADTAADQAKADAAVHPGDLKNSVDAINRFLKPNSEVHFSIDDSSGRSVITVIDTESKKVLRQFPTQQALEIGKDLRGLKGLLVDNKI